MLRGLRASYMNQMTIENQGKNGSYSIFRHVDIWRLPKMGIPLVIIHAKISNFPYETIYILGYHHLWKPPISIYHVWLFPHFSWSKLNCCCLLKAPWSQAYFCAMVINPFSSGFTTFIKRIHMMGRMIKLPFIPGNLTQLDTTRPWQIFDWHSVCRSNLINDHLTFFPLQMFFVPLQMTIVRCGKWSS